MQEIARAFVAGVVAIGMATALFAPGRQTVAGITAGGNAVAKVLQVSETGKS